MGRLRCHDLGASNKLPGYGHASGILDSASAEAEVQAEAEAIGLNVEEHYVTFEALMHNQRAVELQVYGNEKAEDS